MGRGGCAVQVGAADRFEKRLPFLLEPVQPPSRCSAGQAYFDWQVKYQRQVRTKVVLHELLKRGDTFDGQAAPAALIGVSSICEPVTQHRRPTRQRRSDHLCKVLSACSEHQQKLGIGVHHLIARRQQQLTNLFSQWRAAWLAGQHHVQALLAQPGSQVLPVGALARAFGAFQCNKQAAHKQSLLGGVERRRFGRPITVDLTLFRRNGRSR
ncbi:hypothetical protein EDP1_3867 [Pseudomonas putida S610]|nr:hypothetical protein EDP1_3867 [Pseudomonas putida S610]